MKKKVPKDIRKDVDALMVFLKDVQDDAQDLRKMVMKYKKSMGKTQKNIFDQVIILDEILKHYDWFETDVDVNGERVKKIAMFLKYWAKKKKLETSVIDNMDKADHWNFDW